MPDSQLYPSKFECVNIQVFWNASFFLSFLIFRACTQFKLGVYVKLAEISHKFKKKIILNKKSIFEKKNIYTNTYMTYMSEELYFIEDYVDTWQLNQNQTQKCKKKAPNTFFTVFSFNIFYFTYRASHVILDYLQALTQKYSRNVKKTWYFLQENVFISLVPFLKRIHYFLIFWLVPA